eukprot:s1331_g9.t1
MDQRRKLDPLKEAWSADPQRQRFVRELKYIDATGALGWSLLITIIVLSGHIHEARRKRRTDMAHLLLMWTLVGVAQSVAELPKDPAGFQKALDEMDPAQRHAALQRMGISAGLRPPPRPLEKSQARKLMTSLLQILRLISEQLAEAWKLHDARTYEEKLRATLPYVEDIFGPTMEKFGFSTGWPGSFVEVIRSVSAVSNRTGCIKIAAMLDEMDSLLTGQLHEPSLHGEL